MQSIRQTLFVAILLIVAACGTLDKRALLINYGDTKEQVLNVMGPPVLKGDAVRFLS